jgi:hypothetical protein
MCASSFSEGNGDDEHLNVARRFTCKLFAGTLLPLESYPATSFELGSFLKHHLSCTKPQNYTSFDKNAYFTLNSFRNFKHSSLYLQAFAILGLIKFFHTEKSELLKN